MVPWQGGPRCRPSWVPASCRIFLWPSGTAGIHPAASAGPWCRAGQMPAPTAGSVTPPRVSLPPARPHPAAPCPYRARPQEGARHGSKEGLGARCEPWGGFGSHRWHCGTATPQVRDAPGSDTSLGGTVARPHCVSGMLQAQPCLSVAPWRVHTVCLGWSRLSRVSPWHRGVSTQCVWDAPGSDMSLGGTVARPHRVSGMLQAQPCLSVAPWHVYTMCLGCSRLSHVPRWHHSTATPYVRVAFAVCVRTEHPCPFGSSCNLGDSRVAGGTRPARDHVPEQPGAHRADAAGGGTDGPVPCAGCRSQTVV